MMRFIEWRWAISLVVILPVIVVWFVIRGRQRRALRLSRLGTPDMIARLVPEVVRRSKWHIARLGAAGLLFGIAFAGPRWGITRTVVAEKGVDIVLALDASQSMLATDEKPSRLASMKQTVDELRTLSPYDRFALVAFAGRSYILSPLTNDDAALNLFLDNLDPTVVGQGGSSLSSAIRQATNLLALGKSESGKAIVLMSDGEGFESDADVVNEAKRAANDYGIRVITVGFGTTNGSTIPIRENGVVHEKRDENGNIVVTKYSPNMLRAAAAAGGGTFIAAGDPDRARHVRSALIGLRAGLGATGTGADLAPRFQLFLLPGVLLLIADALLTVRRIRRRRTAVVATTSLAASFLFLTSCAGDTDRELLHLYDQGTVLIQHDSLPQATPLLAKATAAKGSELRYRARFNLGYDQLVRGLKLAKAKKDSSDAVLDSTLAVYRAALTERAADLDSKWNYELALRAKRGGGGGGGGAGGGGSNPQPKPSPSPSAEQTPQPHPVAGMGVQKAEQLLNGIADQEQDVQGKKQRKNVPQEPPKGKDW